MIRSSLLGAIPGVRHAFQGPDEPLPPKLASCRQVHGDGVITVTAAGRLSEEGDALITPAQEIAVGIQTADCLPVLLAGVARGAPAGTALVAAVHAGWRGLECGVLPRAVERLIALGAIANELTAAIGPAIGPCCFEVSPEITVAFERKWGSLWSGAPPWQCGRPNASYSPPARSQAPVSENDLWLDLARIARAQLVSVGLTPDRIETTGVCTYCGPGNHASHRRATHEGGRAGRQWSWIGAVFL